MRSIASERLRCPSIMLCQVGEFASSKSAMKTFAPEFSALITILRSVGPVISTRRSGRSAGAGGTRQSPLADAARLGEEAGQLPGAQPRGAVLARGEQLVALAAELALQQHEELARLWGENVGSVHGSDLPAAWVNGDVDDHVLWPPALRAAHRRPHEPGSDLRRGFARLVERDDIRAPGTSE